MNAHAQFNAYMPSLASDAARAYLTGRAFPALDQLSRRARWARNANMLLTAVAALIALIIPILLLLPYSLPVEVMNLVVSGLSIVVVGILFAIVLLRLPVYAAETRLRARQLTTLLHTYFLHADEFTALDDEARLLRLCTKVEQLLS